MVYNILVIEDEPLVADRVVRLASDILGEKLGTVTRSTSVIEAEEALESVVIDIIFLDLYLQGEDGFSLLKKFTAKAAHTIVVSAQDERAIEAFEFGVLDFIAKPFTRERLSRAISRLWQQVDKAQIKTKYITIETIRGVDVVDLKDILFFKAADKYCEAVLKDGSVKFYGKPLNRLGDILSDDFLRVHKSYLVFKKAINDVKSLEGSRYTLNLSSGDQVPVGRSRVDYVREMIKPTSD